MKKRFNDISEETEAWVQIGKFGSAHGIQGEIKVFSYSDVPGRFDNLSSVWWLGTTKSIKRLTVDGFRVCENFNLMKFKEFNSREEVSQLTNGILLLPKSERGQLPAGQYFIDDIIGLKVEDINGHYLGDVIQVYQTAANDIYVIRDREEEILIPALYTFIAEINLEQKKMILKKFKGQ